MADEEKSYFSKAISPDIESIKIDWHRALIGGGISAIVLLSGSWVVGFASGSEAYELFKSTLPSTRSLCGTISLALGNILALMLTLLSLSASMEMDIKWDHYQRVRQVAWFVTVTLIVTILGYVILNIPVVESNKNFEKFYSIMYYSTLSFSAFLGGSFITVVLLLYNTISDMIGMLNPNSSHRLRNKQDDSDE